MTLAADSILAHRRLRRSLTLWRVLAIVGLAAAAIGLVLAAQGTEGGLTKRSDHIARVEISGLITGDDDTLKLLRKLEEANQVKAVIVRIDSPGGTTAGSEAIYLAIRKIAGKKPVAAVMDTVAASGGYITAIATDHIVARGNTITGSVGVIFQWAEIRELLQRFGVKMEEIKSGELKAEPNMFNPLTDQVRTVTQAMVEDSFRWFKELVAERRGLDAQQLGAVSDGRVFTGRQAIAVKLIDEIGGEDRAVAWFEEKKSVVKDLKILDWKPDSSSGSSGLGLSLLIHALQAAGFDAAAEFMQKVIEPERLKLDGLLSIWHAEPH